MFGVLLAVKMYTYYRAVRRLSFTDYAWFIFSWTGFDLVYSPTKRWVRTNISWYKEALRIVLPLLIIPLTCAAAKHIVLNVEVIKRSWILNHICDTVAFIIVVQSFGQVGLGLQRFMGRDPKVIVDNICLSRTPAEFWRRWSWPMHLWLYRYVFLPAGGRQYIVRATLFVFFINALLHEIMAGVAIGRVTGHQTIFFMLNALGVLASPTLERLKDFGPVGVLIMRSITILFMTATAALMFTTFNYIVPIYYRKIWLMW